MPAASLTTREMERVGGDCKARWTSNSLTKKKESQESGWDLGIVSLKTWLGTLTQGGSGSRGHRKVSMTPLPAWCSCWSTSWVQGRTVRVGCFINYLLITLPDLQRGKKRHVSVIETFPARTELQFNNIKKWARGFGWDSLTKWGISHLRLSSVNTR